MALDNTKKTTSFIARGVNKKTLLAIRRLAEQKELVIRNNADLVTWWINEMTPKVLNDVRCSMILVIE
jgi:hypothetical protein